MDRSHDPSSHPGPVGAVVVAAGSGTRLPGSIPKPLLPLGGQTILERTLAAFERSRRIDQVAVVVGAADVQPLRARLRGKVAAVVAGGAERRASVAAGLDALPQVEWVVVHASGTTFLLTTRPIGTRTAWRCSGRWPNGSGRKAGPW